MAPLHGLQSQLLQQDPLGLLFALLEQLAHKLPVGLRNARLAGGEHGNLLGGDQVEVAQSAGPPVTAYEDSRAASEGLQLSHTASPVLQ